MEIYLAPKEELSNVRCECCGLSIPHCALDRKEKHPVVTESFVVTLRGHERHWVKADDSV